MTSKLDRHAEQLSALGHPVRLTILRYVVQAGKEGAPAGDIQSRVDLPASTLSHHLKRLVDAGLLTTSQRGDVSFLRRRLRRAAGPHGLPVGGLLQARRQERLLLSARS